MGVTAILLAAGQSSRMGKLKGLLPWKGVTLFEHQLMTLEKSSVEEIIVVVAEQFMKLAKYFLVRMEFNKNYPFGKCSSILSGLQAMKNPKNNILIAALDQPLDTDTINSLSETLAGSGHPIAVPVFLGKRGHPILFSGSLHNDLLTINEETMGLRSIFQKYKDTVMEVPVNNPAILLNLNTPDDYQMALKCVFKKED
ncbi:nucleotidyltransferase family protein [Pseudalkalibacillus decolorationis]|uniref:nucleotidyltransferase family protein n=1 Tax=Pseudalkalibacillus decolorationis TaxID=163879 RepID=UPI0021477C74|nr:nucleotidyltransferase family protein [Pseudalkalibacillus decolorationis]